MWCSWASVAVGSISGGSICLQYVLLPQWVILYCSGVIGLS